MKKVAVVIEGNYYFTPDTKEDAEKAIIRNFSTYDAHRLVDGLSVHKNKEIIQ